jgi:hypothetical protein
MAPSSENIIAKFQESISAIFDQAQLTLANHRKNCVALYKLHQQATAVTQPSKKDNVIKLVGERAFGDAFVDMVNRVLVVKKGPATADRVVKFVGSYVKFMNEKGMWILCVWTCGRTTFVLQPTPMPPLVRDSDIYVQCPRKRQKLLAILAVQG